MFESGFVQLLASVFALGRNIPLKKVIVRVFETLVQLVRNLRAIAFNFECVCRSESLCEWSQILKCRLSAAQNRVFDSLVSLNFCNELIHTQAFVPLFLICVFFLNWVAFQRVSVGSVAPAASKIADLKPYQDAGQAQLSSLTLKAAVHLIH